MYDLQCINVLIRIKQICVVFQTEKNTTTIKNKYYVYYNALQMQQVICISKTTYNYIVHDSFAKKR